MKLRSRRGCIFHQSPFESTNKADGHVGQELPESHVRTNYGIVAGRRVGTKQGFEADCFLGVPYAQPPVGHLRFRKPVAPEPWTGIKKCRRFGARCIQKDMFWDKFTCLVPQSEDCLYLNIFAPAIQPGKKYPVLFYIHGGGFMMDSSVRYRPSNVTRLIVSKGVIVVTCQYRLGYLGFLSTGDDAAKGNFGLWDQIEALKWTKENIHHFGGDPQQITVSGQSAGAVSADLLSLSPVSRDMFNRKIVMGANAFCHWATTTTEEITEHCRRKALKLGWKPRSNGYATHLEENEDMVEFLRNVPASRFATHMIGSRPVFHEARLPLAPVIDGELLPAHPEVLRLSAPNMDSIVGVGEQESLLFIALGLIRCDGKNIDRVTSQLCKKIKSLSTAQVLDMVKQIYGDPATFRKDKKKTRETMVTMLSDIVSNYACHQYMRNSQSEQSNCYAYSFDYTSDRVWGWLMHVVPFMAGTHCSDIIYLFDCNYFSSPLPMSSQDRKVSEETADWFTQFVKTGNPNKVDRTDKFVQWEPVEKDGNMSMLSICGDHTMKKQIFDGRMDLLEKLRQAAASKE